MEPAELTGLPATALADLVARRVTSAEEVVTAHLARIAAVDGAVNAVVALDPERALAAAERPTRRSPGAAGRPAARRPVHRKDNLDAAGLVMAIGVRARAASSPRATRPRSRG